eukprot:TRINITY_DN38707_c0_g1_i1.p1 TRINITY_DN38707_c0_g1~~TRINITY_DN38707_c0_g1_i1.p1  ORF type:complete len:182 (+),score=60.15 TRINITY_DN38707_c0_g1_i1:139-684(+)
MCIRDRDRGVVMEILEPHVMSGLRVLESPSCQIQISQLAEALFALADTNEDGELSPRELTAAMAWLIDHPKEMSDEADLMNKLEQLFATVDTSGTGLLGKRQVSQWLRKVIRLKEQLLRLLLRCAAGLVTSTLDLLFEPVSYTHLRAHETPEHLVCRLLLEKKKKRKKDEESHNIHKLRKK